MAFSLADNPFARLGVSVRARAARIEDAFEDAVIDHPHEETALLKMKQALTFPKPRLENELRWLPDLSPAKAEQVMAALRSGDAQETLRLLQYDSSRLSAANIAADACGRFSADLFADRLVAAHADLSVAEVAQEINAVRAASGFGAVGEPQIEQAMAGVRSEHASALVEAAADGGSPGARVAQLLKGRAGAFEDQVAEAYGRWAAPQLREIETAAKAKLKGIEATGEGLIREVASELRTWSDISAPLQLQSDARGLDEPRSLKLYIAARNAAIALANDHGLYDAAHELTEVLSEVFGCLPSARRQLPEDLEALRGLQRDVAQNEIVQPLEVCVGELSTRSRQSAVMIESQAWHGVELAKLDQTFDSVRAAGSDDLAFVVIRAFSLKLNTDGFPRAALILLDRYLAKASGVRGEARAQAERDLLILRSNADQKDLNRALEDRRFSEAGDIAMRMLSYERDDDARQILRQICTGVQKRREARRSQIAGWVVTGVIFLGIVAVAQGNRTPAYTPRPSYAAYDGYGEGSGAQPAADAAQAATNASSQDYGVQAEPDIATPTVEIPPLPDEGGATRVLTQMEIENCLIEQDILDQLRTLTPSDGAIARFNLRVDAYNTQCGEFQYRQTDMARAQTAVAGRRAETAAEARRLAEAWAYE